MRLERLQFVMQFCFTNFVYLIKNILCFLLTLCLVVNVLLIQFFFFLLGGFVSFLYLNIHKLKVPLHVTLKDKAPAFIPSQKHRLIFGCHLHMEEKQQFYSKQSCKLLRGSRTGGQLI